MNARVNPIPENYQRVIPYLSINGAAAAIDFYKKALGAKERARMGGPDGKIGHAELEIGDCVVMLADENPEMGGRSPKSLGGSPVSLVVYVDDVDAVIKRSVDAGAKVTRPVADQFYGDRTGGIEDPFGHQWWIHTHIEDVSPEEMEKRMAAATPA